MDISKRRTKIICTVGPVSSDKLMLKKLAIAGMNVVRLNFSHGDHDTFRNIIGYVREIEAEIGRPIGIMADIQGPKLRVGKLPGKEVTLKANSEVWITIDGLGGERDGKTWIPVAYKEFIKDVGPNCTILFDDGLLSIKTIETTSEGIRCQVLDAGTLYENKGINVPEVSFSASAITEKDYADILFCVETGVDYIALSFVRTAQEVKHLKEFVKSRGKRIQVLAKVEKRDALRNLEAIIDVSDGVLVARGDLAVEVGNERVPVLQKQIVRTCNLHGKVVIIATQMLMSMVDNPRPSRAEASDVANAIVDGADALMLSNETTVGKYPLETVEMMAKIILEMETQLPLKQAILFDEWELASQGEATAIALLQSSVRLAAIVTARLMVVVTQSGNSARLVSKCRPGNSVLAITGSQITYRQSALYWGVDAIFMEDMESLISQTAVFEAIGQRLLALNLCSTGDKIVITAGLPRLAHGSTNTIKVHQI